MKTLTKGIIDDLFSCFAEGESRLRDITQKNTTTANEDFKAYLQDALNLLEGVQKELEVD